MYGVIRIRRAIARRFYKPLARSSWGFIRDLAHPPGLGRRRCPLQSWEDPWTVGPVGAWWGVSGSVFRSFFGSAAAPSANWLLHCDTARGVRRGRPCIDLARRRSHGSMAHLPQLPAQARRGAHTAWRCVPWGTGSAEAPQKWTTDPPAAAVLERRRP